MLDEPTEFAQIMQEYCAEAMTWGMPYERFWHGSLNEYFAYMRTAALKEQKKLHEADFTAWRQGSYVRDALTSVYHMFNVLIDQNKATKYPYPEKPYYLLQEQEKERKKKAGIIAERIKIDEEHNRKIQLLKQRARNAHAETQPDTEPDAPPD